LLVVGGGITGAGIARDAALRGLAVALVERNDFAAGTSSRSSKLIHGGVRYLEQGDVALVRESADERQVLRRLAPHLTAPLLMVMPTYGRTMHTKLAVGLWTFEKIATVPADERHAMWTREETLRNEPALDGERLFGAATFTEYLTDDARLVLATVKGAHAAGAHCVNHVAVTGLDPGGTTTVVHLRDALAGASCRVSARVVVNAAGPWVDAVRALAGAAAGRRLHLTKGIHLAVPHARLPIRHPVAMQTRDRRSASATARPAEARRCRFRAGSGPRRTSRAVFRPCPQGRPSGSCASTARTPKRSSRVASTTSRGSRVCSVPRSRTCSTRRWRSRSKTSSSAAPACCCSIPVRVSRASGR